MKLRVVHDAEGRIVAAAAVDGGDGDFSLVPIPGEGQSAAEVDVPGEYQHEDLASLCTRFRVDVDGPRLRLADDSA